MSHLEQWARDQRLSPAAEALQPIIQAAQLLQARKSDDDVISVCEMCNKLTANQIIKILNLYTPADDFETRVPVSFIRKVQTKLEERGERNEQVCSFVINYTSQLIMENLLIDNFFIASHGFKIYLCGPISFQSV